MSMIMYIVCVNKPIALEALILVHLIPFQGKQATCIVSYKYCQNFLHFTD